MHTIEQLRSGELYGTKQIKISEQLTAIPSDLYQYADTLEILDLSGNALTSLPDEFVIFKKLRILFLSNNAFEVFPKVLGKLTSLDMVGFKANQIQEIPEQALPVSLRWLILTDNKIKALPASIGLCTKLQKVMLAGNCLTTLPDQMASCINIELLRISANNFETFPGWLLTLPKLAWLACAGNPYIQYTKPVQSDVILWNSIDIKEQLGEGASGNIYKATYKQTDTLVAVKIFKGTVTSDGLPVDEMQACLQAGRHPNMVAVKGVIKNHPEHKQGLVMELVPSGYRNLGLPPDFTTCTRDTFAADQMFTINQIIRIAHGVASVAAQLHERGIMHGDLYAHNILVDESSEPLFGDFGAATVFSTSHTDFVKYAEKIEVRAFGCLLEDLVTRLKKEESAQAEPFIRMKNSCMTENIESRPTFKSILKQLATEFIK